MQVKWYSADIIKVIANYAPVFSATMQTVFRSFQVLTFPPYNVHGSYREYGTQHADWN